MASVTLAEAIAMIATTTINSNRVKPLGAALASMNFMSGIDENRYCQVQISAFFPSPPATPSAPSDMTSNSLLIPGIKY